VQKSGDKVEREAETNSVKCNVVFFELGFNYIGACGQGLSCGVHSRQLKLKICRAAMAKYWQVVFPMLQIVYGVVTPPLTKTTCTAA
jgi:hypothetical protein